MYDSLLFDARIAAGVIRETAESARRDALRAASTPEGFPSAGRLIALANRLWMIADLAEKCSAEVAALSTEPRLRADTPTSVLESRHAV